MNKKGFTLIEIIVVVAIIGILALIVIVAVNKPQNAAADASVKQNLIAIRKQSEIYYLTSGVYGDSSSSCVVGSESGMFADTTIKSAMSEVGRNIGGSKIVTCHISSDGNNWAISVNALKSTGSTLCIDSSGILESDLSAGSDGTCE